MGVCRADARQVAAGQVVVGLWWSLWLQSWVGVGRFCFGLKAKIWRPKGCGTRSTYKILLYLSSLSSWWGLWGRWWAGRGGFCLQSFAVGGGEVLIQKLRCMATTFLPMRLPRVAGTYHRKSKCVALYSPQASAFDNLRCAGRCGKAKGQHTSKPLSQRPHELRWRRSPGGIDTTDLLWIDRACGVAPASHALQQTFTQCHTSLARTRLLGLVVLIISHSLSCTPDLQAAVVKTGVDTERQRGKSYKGEATPLFTPHPGVVCHRRVRMHVAAEAVCARRRACLSLLAKRHRACILRHSNTPQAWPHPALTQTWSNKCAIVHNW